MSCFRSGYILAHASFLGLLGGFLPGIISLSFHCCEPVLSRLPGRAYLRSVAVVCLVDFTRSVQGEVAMCCRFYFSSDQRIFVISLFVISIYFALITTSFSHPRLTKIRLSAHTRHRYPIFTTTLWGFPWGPLTPGNGKM
jgi:hypothetical protein